MVQHSEREKDDASARKTRRQPVESHVAGGVQIVLLGAMS